MIATMGVSSDLLALRSDRRISAENIPDRSATAAPIMIVRTRPRGAKLAKVRGISVNKRVMFASENRLDAAYVRTPFSSVA